MTIRDFVGKQQRSEPPNDVRREDESQAEGYGREAGVLAMLVAEPFCRACPSYATASFPHPRRLRVRGLADLLAEAGEGST